MDNYLIAHHLGLGDHVVLNGLVRHIFNREKDSHERIYLLCYEHNLPNVKRMYSDIPLNYVLITHNSQIANAIKNFDGSVEDLHLNGKEVYKYPDYCDEAFFLNFNYPVELLQEFKVERDRDRESFVSLNLHAYGEYLFVNDDPERGLSIDESKLPQGIRIIRPGREIPMFDLLGVMENAKECHFISSSFLCIALAYKGLIKNAVAHLYVKNVFLSNHLNKYGIKTITE